MSIAALDLGRRRIGFAIADADGIAAHPIAAIERRSLRRDIEELAARMAAYGVTQVVIGLPLNMDGSAGAAARMAEAFADNLRKVTGLTVDLFDERLTSFEAEERLKAIGGRRLRSKQAIDAVAACVILEGWIEQQRLAR
jgi:putative holliday junction resolvase